MIKNNIITQNKFNDYPQTYQFYIGKPAIVMQNSDIEVSELKLIRFEIQKIISKKGYLVYKKNINTRLDYLESVLDENQDKEIFALSRKTVDEFVTIIKKTEEPLISVDAAGNIVFEWHDYNSYDFIMMLFRTDSKISMTGIKENRCVIKIQGAIEEVVKNFLKVL